jgi:hypothetical protein
MQGLKPEEQLIAAFLSLVLADARHGLPHQQAEAKEFLKDTAAVRFWCSLIGVDDDAWGERVRPYLQ